VSYGRYNLLLKLIITGVLDFVCPELQKLEHIVSETGSVFALV
jgi:hypothetical protein